MPTKYGPNTLWHALYFDDMKLTRKTHRHAWSITARIPTVGDAFATDTAEHVTLRSPDLGTVYYHIIEGSVDAAIVNEFLINLLEHHTTWHPTSGQRALIFDNVSSHRTHNAYASIHAEAMRNVLCAGYLPRYSPFLNPKYSHRSSSG
ncbi:TPA: hypothetical protein N0F65_003521 [Lagenidium giganteum]|uniref:Tc1-like transposase DDE domain-containing protein n=1 Tax=Lagenidium giganteum TaxID=4803 RepID=A0AAV2Z4V1_9STRA|nr:TPA: hypothetical protein N0F65_003521 [Lagenidium giganteum]